MATSTFDVSDSRIYQSGRFEFGYIASQRCMVFFGLNSTLDFTATGTDCTIKWAVTATGTNYLQVSVDGGAFSNLTVPGSINTYTDTTLFTGLSDAAHTVTIKHNAGTQTNSYLQDVAGLSITGASPALAVPSAASFGALYRGNGGEFLRYCLPDGWVERASSNGHNTLNLSTADSGFRFRANPTSIQLFALLNGATVRVWQDGATIGSVVTLANTSVYGWTSLATGLDGATHEYMIANVRTLVPTTVGINLIGGDLDKVTPVSQRPAILWLGDSITAGTGTNDSSLSFPALISYAKGYQSINQGVSGQKTLETSTTASSTERNHPVYLPPNVYPTLIKYVVVNSGHNDSGAANLGASNSELRAAYVRLFTKLKAAYPQATIYAVSPFDTTGYATTVRDNIAADMSAAATTVGAPITYIRACSTAGQANFTDGALTAAGDLSDGTHPNSTGYTHIYNYLVGNFTTASSLFGSGGAVLSRIRTGM